MSGNGMRARRRAALVALGVGGFVAGFTAPARADDGDAAAVLPEIVVESAARDGRALLDTPSAVTVVDSAELERRQASTFEEVMGSETGATIYGGPRAIAQEPNIRGFADDQIVLRLDGARQNFGSAHRGRFFIDPDMIGRVEILRGGASALYGSGALGGAITMETKDAADFLDPGERFGGRLKLGWNSQGNAWLGSVAGAARQGPVEGVGFVAYRPMSRDLEDGDGQPIIDSDVDMMSGLAKVAFEPSLDHRFELKYQRYADDGKTPPNANVQGSPSNVVERDMLAQGGVFSWDWNPVYSTALDLTATAYVNDVDLSEDRIADGRLDETRLTTIGGEIVNRSSFTLGLPIRASYGIEAFEDTQEATRNGAARPQSPDATRRFMAGFAQAEVSVTDTVTLTPGLRYDYFELSPESAGFAERSESQLSPRIAVNWRPTPNSQLYASAARSFRAPDLTELYATGVHFASGGFPMGGGLTFTGVNEFIAAPDLKPERSTAFEIGGRYILDAFGGEGARLTLSANAYAANVSDYIDQTVNFIDFATFDPIANTVGGSTTLRNVDAQFWGFEADAEYDAQAWFAKVGVTVPRGRAADGGALGSIPADRVVITGGFRPFEGVEIGARSTMADGQDDVPSTGTAAPGYVVFDVFASYEPLDGLRFSARADNVFDRAYRVYPNGVNSQGVSFKLGASVDF